MENIASLEDKLGFQFQNRSVLMRALTHRSYLNENPNMSLEDNERLEFLGDAVLDFLVGAYLYHRFPEMDEGGVEGETLDFAVYLTRQGHRSIVISGGGRLVSQLQDSGVEHILWKNVGSKNVHCLKYIPKLKQFIIREKIDVVHLRSRLPAWIGYLAWKSIDENRRPALITSFHGFYSVNSYSTIMTKGERVIAVSGGIKDHILDNYPIDRSKIRLVHGGYDANVFDPQKVNGERVRKLREAWAVGEAERPVIMLPGRFTFWKGQDVFINSLIAIKDRDFLALCVGAAEENSSFVRKLKEKIETIN